MLSFNKGGLAIARIYGGEYDKQILYLYDEFDEENTIKTDPREYLDENLFIENRTFLKKRELERVYNAIAKEEEIDPEEDPYLYKMYRKGKKYVENKKAKELLLNDGYVQLIPNAPKNQRQVLYIFGMGGVGKSTYIGKYIQEYNKLYPKNKVYIFSRKNKDEELDKNKITRIILDESFIESEPLPIEAWKNSLCVFDDVDTTPNKEVLKAVCALRDDLLECGRSENIYMCVSSHLACNYRTTKTSINESTHYVFFKGTNIYHVKRILKEYAGFNSKQIQETLGLHSRWTVISKLYPSYVLYEYGAYIL